MLVRWLATLFLSLALAGGLYAAYYAYLEHENAERHKQSLEASLRQLAALEQTLAQQEQQALLWAALWEEAKEVKLTQEKWVTNKLDFRQTANWTQVEQLLSFLSNSDPTSTGYWFKPDYVRVAKGDKNGETKQTEEGKAGNSGGDRVGGETYTIIAKGEFLIPKL